MPFDSTKQQKWYHATNQTFFDDEPESARKVKGEGEDPEFKDLTTSAGGDLDPQNKNLQTTQGSIRESLEFEGENYVISPEGYTPKNEDLIFENRIYIKEVTEEEKSLKRGEPVEAPTYKEMRESLLKNDVKQIIAKAIEEFKEEDHPRDGGKFTSQSSDKPLESFKPDPDINYKTKKYLGHEPSNEESIAKEEGLASVSGPPADSTMRIMSNKTFVKKDEENLTDEDLTDKDLTNKVLGEELKFEGKIYSISKEGHIPKDDDIEFEGKLYSAKEGVGNCQFCAGKGQVTVENLGIKDCPDCDGTGDIQQPSPIAPDITGQVDPILQQIPQQVPRPNQPTQQAQIPQQPMQDPNQIQSPPQQAPEEKEFPPKEKPKFGEAKQKTIACEKSMKQYRGYIAKEIEVLKKKAKANEAVSVMYGLPTISKQGKKIKGILAYAGVSLNDRIYLPEELAKGHGLTLPLLLNHSNIAGAEEELDRLDDDMRGHLENEKDFKIGEVTLDWDQEKLTLFYEGVIEHPFFQKEVDDADMAVSLGIYYDSDSPVVCDDNCYTIIKGAEFREVSLVYHPGFPIATIEAVENELKESIMKKQKAKEDHLEKLNQLKKNEEEEQTKGEDETEDIQLIADVIKDVKEGGISEEYEHTGKHTEISNAIQRDNPEIDKDRAMKIANSQIHKYSLEGEDDKEETVENEEDIIITDDPEILDQVTQVPAEDWNAESLATEANFSIRGINGFTISNSNGVTRYELDPSNGYENNWLHVNVNKTGAKLFGERFQLQPKMTTPPELTKEIEKRPDIKFTEPDEDAFKKKQKAVEFPKKSIVDDPPYGKDIVNNERKYGTISGYKQYPFGRSK